MIKKLYKNEDGKVFAGVMSGLGDYFDLDPILLRVIYILVAFVTAVVPAILAYIVAAIIIPKRPAHMHSTHAH